MYDNIIDKKWQEKWYSSDCFNAKDDKTKKKFYGLVEFPYPSGVGLHIGHVKAYIGLDVIARQPGMRIHCGIKAKRSDMFRALFLLIFCLR